MIERELTHTLRYPEPSKSNFEQPCYHGHAYWTYLAGMRPFRSTIGHDKLDQRGLVQDRSHVALVVVGDRIQADTLSVRPPDVKVPVLPRDFVAFHPAEAFI